MGKAYADSLKRYRGNGVMFDYSQRKNTKEYNEGYERIFGRKRKKDRFVQGDEEWIKEYRDAQKKGLKNERG